MTYDFMASLSRIDLWMTSLFLSLTNSSGMGEFVTLESKSMTSKSERESMLSSIAFATVRGNLKGEAVAKTIDL